MKSPISTRKTVALVELTSVHHEDLGRRLAWMEIDPMEHDICRATLRRGGWRRSTSSYMPPLQRDVRSLLLDRFIARVLKNLLFVIFSSSECKRKLWVWGFKAWPNAKKPLMQGTSMRS